MIDSVTLRRNPIDEAAGVGTALEEFRKTKPSIVLLDMMMPGGRGGLDVLKSILNEQPDAMIVLLTALARDHPDVREALSLGAVGYLQKPVTMAALREVMSELERLPTRGTRGV